MVIDTSAIIAILLGEAEAGDFIRRISQATERRMSPISALEAAIVINSRKGSAGGRELDLFFYESALEIVSMDKEQYELARKAYVKYGKGRHPAGLNLGDCCSYALAVSLGDLLLFKGSDFNLTDVNAA